MRGNKTPGESGYFGVYRHPDRKRWTAQITEIRDGKRLCRNLGYHLTKEEAARAFDKEAFRLYGEKANLNFPEGIDRLRHKPFEEMTHEELFGEKPKRTLR